MTVGRHGGRTETDSGAGSESDHSSAPDHGAASAGTDRNRTTPRFGRRAARHRADRSPFSGSLDAGLAWPLAALALLAVLGLRMLHSASSGGEGLLAADGFLRASGSDSSPGLSLPHRLAVLVLAAWTWLTGPVPGAATLVAAGRQLLLAVVLGGAVVLWRTCRRLDTGNGPTAVALLAFGVPMLLGEPVLLDLPAVLALPPLLLAAWLLAPSRSGLARTTPRSTPGARLLALACLGAASLLAPDTLLLVLAWLALQVGRSARSSRSPMAWAVCAGAGAAFGALAVAVRFLDAPPAGGPAAGRGIVVLAGVTAVAVAAAAAWRLPAFRVPALAVVASGVVSLVPAPRLSGLLVCLPAAAPLAAQLLERAGAARPRPVSTARRGPAPRAALVLVGALGTVLGAMLIAAVAVPARRSAGDRAPAELLRWAGAELPPDTRLAAPPRLAADLRRAGASSATVPLPNAAPEGDAEHPVLVLTDGTPPPGAQVVGRFSSTDPARSLLVVDPHPGIPTPEELRRRKSLAGALVANPSTEASGRVSEVLKAGSVDPRLLTLLAAIGAHSGVGIAAFPGEDEVQPRMARRALVSSMAGRPVRPGLPAAEELLAWVAAQRPPFAPDTVTLTDAGVLLDYRYVSAPDALVSRVTG